MKAVHGARDFIGRNPVVQQLTHPSRRAALIDQGRFRTARREQGFAVLGGVGIGAVLAYLFGRTRGKRRRAELRNKSIHLVQKARHAGDVTSRDAANRARGAVSEIKSRLTREEIDDEVLVDRVRSKLGQVVTHPSAIEVEASDRRVTLSGPVLAEDVDSLKSGIPRIRGVREVVDRLDVHETADNVPGLQGIGRTPRKFGKVNWSPTARLGALAGGSGLLAMSWVRRGPVGIGAGITGAALMSRAVTNIPITRLTGVTRKRRGIDIQTAINIDASVDKVFELSTDYENFPRWMSNVKEVKPLEQGQSRWKIAGPVGAPVMFDAEVSAFQPNERFGWRTVEEAAIKHSGLAEFQSNPDGSTRLQIRMTYNPMIGGLGHALAKVLGSDPKKKLDEDLLRLKSFIETGRPASDAAQA